jgi:two-component system sensor histidine kinase VicK
VPRKLFIAVLAIVVIPVSMTCWKIVQYARASKSQIFDLHHHIVHTLALNTTTYFNQLNMRLAFAPLLTRSKVWSEQLSILNNALMSNTDFACVALLDPKGKEKAKAFDSSLTLFALPIDYSQNALFAKVVQSQSADAGAVYEKNGASFFDILYPLENGQFMMVAVRWESLKNLLFDQQVGQGGFIWLMEETGRVVGDSHHEQHVGQTYPAWLFFQQRLETQTDWSGEFEGPDGLPMVGAGSWVKGAGWFVLSAQTQQEAYAKAQSLRRSAFFWMVISFSGMVWFGVFWVKDISLPITRLAAGVNAVARRQFDEKVQEDFGLDEFRALGSAFNNMMKELKVYEGMQVDRIIEEKTTVQTLLFSMRDGILMIGKDGKLSFSNEPARVWALEVAGRGKDFNYAWDQLQQYPPFMDALQPVLDHAKTTMSEEFEFPVAGRPRWARVMAQVVSTEKGRQLGVMVVIRDITQDKELDRMKEDFFNGITHDLRTPLAATIGYLGLSEMQVPESEKELVQLVGSARQSAKRALGLVETILSLARLQAGKLNISKTPVNARELVAKIARDMTFHAQAKKISISADCPEEDLWVLADPGLIERVVENLTGNAIKYTMEKGWVKLQVASVQSGIEISIQDNGRGIPQEALTRLFGKFQQVKAEDRSVGFGIGLSFSKGIVEAHGSSIQVDSEVGKGSKFSFILERAAAPAKQSSNPAAAA